MPADRFFKPEERASQLVYLLGLDRSPDEETRSPYVADGDPALIDALEEAYRWKDDSCNYVVGWDELLPWKRHETTQAHSRKVIMSGIPETDYAMVIIGHDEPVRDKKTKKKTGKKRAADHVKISHVCLPTGARLQAFYSARDRLLTTLFLADASIRNNWSHGLDRDRAIEVVGHHRNEALRDFQNAINQAVKSVARLPNGKPDAKTILERFDELRLPKMSAVTRIVGRKGVSLSLDDHPHPVRFFGEAFECLHDHIKTNETNKDEHERCNTISPETEFFPGGYLERSPIYAKRISEGLSTWISKRAGFNIKRYHLDSPTVVLGGFRRGDPNGLGWLDGMAHMPEPVSKGPDSLFRGDDKKPAESVESDSAKVGINLKEKEDLNEHAPTRNPAEEEWNPDLCGAYPDLGILAETLARIAARIIQSTHAALEGLCGTIRTILEGRVRGAQQLVEANQRLGGKIGHIDQVIDRLAYEATRLGEGGVGGYGNETDGSEFVRRVKRKPVGDIEPTMRPIPTPKVGPDPEMEQ